VLIPRANTRHLMLADDVLHAADEGRFHVWGIDTIDQGMALLTGQPAGERGDDGTYPRAR
jgi:predicted ATP-dependent protease